MSEFGAERRVADPHPDCDRAWVVGQKDLGSVDVAIVGAGLAGLYAARLLTQSGLTVRVVEARDRVGGRTLSKNIGKARFDLGGQWLGPTQDRMASLVHEFGIETFDTHTEGTKILDRNGRISTYESSIPSLPIWQLLLLQRSIKKVESAAARVSALRPQDLKDALQLDAQTVETFKRKHATTDDVRWLLDVAVRTIFGADPGEMSLLFFLHYLKTGGGLMRLAQTKDGAQQTRFVPGAQTVSLRLAEALGESIVLSAPVRRVVHEASSVRVETDAGVLKGRAALLCVPPHLAARIEFDPLLPPRRDQLWQRTPMGATAKVLVNYEEAFWRNDGFSGEVVSEGKPVTVVFDNSSSDLAQPQLLAFIVGPPTRTWGSRPADERKSSVLDSLARMFGKKALHPTDYVEQDWCKERWTLGCPTSIMGPMVLTELGRDLGTPLGRLFFAGTETATEWRGYMEGALQSAERATTEIRDALL